MRPNEAQLYLCYIFGPTLLRKRLLTTGKKRRNMIT